MSKLSEELKYVVVQAVACWDTPSQVARMLRDEYGVTITKQQVQYYDPTKVHGRRLGPKLKALFYETRRLFIEESAKIPIAQQSYRLRVLQRTLEKVEQQGNAAMVAHMLEQAAKEVGGAFTNRRELTGPAGGPMQTQQVPAPVDPMEAAAAYTKLMQG